MEDLFKKYGDYKVIFYNEEVDLQESPSFTMEELYQALKGRIQAELKIPIGLGCEDLIDMGEK